MKKRGLGPPQQGILGHMKKRGSGHFLPRGTIPCKASCRAAEQLSFTASASECQSDVSLVSTELKAWRCIEPARKSYAPKSPTIKNFPNLSRNLAEVMSHSAQSTCKSWFKFVCHERRKIWVKWKHKRKNQSFSFKTKSEWKGLFVRSKSFMCCRSRGACSSSSTKRDFEGSSLRSGEGRRWVEGSQLAVCQAAVVCIVPLKSPP